MLSIIIPSNALYFYMDGQTPKCFLEELPKDTLVVGALLGPFPERVARCVISKFAENIETKRLTELFMIRSFQRRRLPSDLQELPP